MKFFQLSAFLDRLTRKEKLFLILCLLWVGLRATERLAGIDLPGTDLLNFVLILFAIVLGVIYLRRLIRRTLWRLRNRLIITYVLMGVVPIILILAMAGIAMYILMGQVATYLVTTELKRRNDLVRDSAYVLAWHVLDRRDFELSQAAASQFLSEVRKRLPHLQTVVRANGKTFPVPADASVNEFPVWTQPGFAGLVNAGREYALAAHVEAQGSSRSLEVFAYEPADPDLLAHLLPGLASIQFLDLESTSSSSIERHGRETRVTVRFSNQSTRSPEASPFAKLPSAKAWWDILVRWGTPVPVWQWDSQANQQTFVVVAVLSRPSLIINQLFSTLGELAQALKLALMIIGGLFLVVEFASMVFGLGLTRTITRSVADLYEATLKIKAGDFSQRIPIRTNDQLSELASSFNSMTENIQNLIIESKEKERLESELEIAREVQSQLFPKGVPRLKTLELAGLCNPARIVSGDYYDFVTIGSGLTALAIGDIAGKGISAALLMASIQSSLRAQLMFRDGSQSFEQPGNSAISTSKLVTLLNRQLYESTTPEKFASFYVGVYNDDDARLFYTNAGHLPPILIRKGKASRLEISGMVIGAFPDVPYDQDCIQLKPEDLLVAFTDGITEPENEYGEEFGEKRLTDLVVRNAQRPLSELVTTVTNAVSEWSNRPEPQDDMTLLLARRL